MASKKLAVIEKAQALSPFQQELMDEASQDRAKETLGVPRVTHKGGVLMVDGVKVKDNKIQVGIIDYAFVKSYYDGEYDPNVMQTPVCYAMGKDEGVLKPHANAPDKQSTECSACDHNKFGTALKGRGKRCKDERRIMIIAEAGDPTSIQKAEVRQISVPPGSLKGWGNYLNSLRDVTPSGNIRSVLTEISTQPGKVGAHELTFKAVGVLPDEAVGAILQRRQGVEGQLLAPFPNIEAEEKAAPKNRRASVK